MEVFILAVAFAIGAPLLILFLGIAANESRRKHQDKLYKAEYRRERRLQDEVDREWGGDQ